MSVIDLRTQMQLKNQEETIRGYQKLIKEKDLEIYELKAVIEKGTVACIQHTNLIAELKVRDAERLELLIKKNEEITDLKKWIQAGNPKGKNV